MLEAIASLTRSSSFLRRAGSIVQLHNTNIKYNSSNTYVLKTKRKISGSWLPIYPWEGYHAVYSLPIYLVGVIRRRVISLSTLHGDIGRLNLSNKLWLFRILYAGFAGLNEFSELSALSYSPKMSAMNICIQDTIEPKLLDKLGCLWGCS